MDSTLGSGALRNVRSGKSSAYMGLDIADMSSTTTRRTRRGAETGSASGASPSSVHKADPGAEAGSSWVGATSPAALQDNPVIAARTRSGERAKHRRIG
jgi:hypothetical protein